jgi:hypothetical protein
VKCSFGGVLMLLLQVILVHVRITQQGATPNTTEKKTYHTKLTCATGNQQVSAFDGF